MLLKIVEIFIAGWLLLGWAIVLNLFANRIQLASWYTLLGKTQHRLRFVDLLWLLILYPMLLGGALVVITVLLVRNI